MNSDMETLLKAATYGMQERGETGVLALSESLSSGTQSPGTATRGVTSSPGPADLAVEIRKLLDVATASQAASVTPPKTGTASNAAQEASVGETVVRTAAMMTGVGPLVTGLLKLFGSNDAEALPALEKFSAPAPVSVEAGLTRDREYSAVRHSQGGTPEALNGSSARTSQAATIQVNIQAMDSQSFLDRQDDIARAVREAMLHSNSLNDVVMEL